MSLLYCCCFKKKCMNLSFSVLPLSLFFLALFMKKMVIFRGLTQVLDFRSPLTVSSDVPCKRLGQVFKQFLALARQAWASEDWWGKRCPPPVPASPSRSSSALPGVVSFIMRLVLPASCSLEPGEQKVNRGRAWPGRERGP